MTCYSASADPPSRTLTLLLTSTVSTDDYSIGEKREDRKSSGLSSLFHRATEKLPAVSSIPHQLRQQAVLLNPSQLQETRQFQLAIKSYAGVVQDHVALAREGQVFSKQLFLWSKDDKDQDVVDICDRIAFIQFKTSELEAEAVAKLEESRAKLKDIRNFENDLVPRRRNAAAISVKIAALRKEKPSTKTDDQLSKLTSELSQLEIENATFEASFDTLKRAKLHEAFALQFAAQKELGEKLAIVSGYGELLLQGMETDGIANDYRGQDRTARVKAELEDALNSWTASPAPKLKEPSGSGFLNRSDSRSFGATHAAQLSQLDNSSSQPVFSTQDSQTMHAAQGRVVPPVPPHPSQPSVHHQDLFHDAHASSSHIPPPLPARTHGAALSPSPSATGSGALAGGSLPINLSPTARPVDATSSSSPLREMSIPLPPPGVDLHGGEGLAPPEPTVAETGEPIQGTGGPSSGQLRPRGGSQSQIPAQTQRSQLDQDQAIKPQEQYNAAGWGEGNMPGGFGGGASMAGPEEVLPAYGDGDDEAARARDAAERILAEERERKAT
ncbi:hypothetical protein JCM11641_006395 [Rhodosporidiobolus odoratus]